MKNTLLIWSHGKDSSPWGTKSTAMANLAEKMDFKMVGPDYQGMMNPDDRVNKLVDFCKTLDQPFALIGSSMGGYTSACAACTVEPTSLFLLAPAFYYPGFHQTDFSGIKVPVTVVHGWHDDVVPVENALKFSREYSAEMHILDAAHRLSSKLPVLLDLFRLFLEKIH